MTYVTNEFLENKARKPCTKNGNRSVENESILRFVFSLYKRNISLSQINIALIAVYFKFFSVNHYITLNLYLCIYIITLNLHLCIYSITFL